MATLTEIARKIWAPPQQETPAPNSSAPVDRERQPDARTAPANPAPSEGNANRAAKRSNEPDERRIMAVNVQATFDLACLRHEAKHLALGKHWKERQAITQLFEHQRRRVKAHFLRDYDTRVAMVQKRLMHEAGRKSADLQWKATGRDRFDKTALRLQAERDVRSDHIKSLARLDRAETRDLKSLINRAKRSNAMRNLALDPFNKARLGNDPDQAREPRTDRGTDNPSLMNEAASATHDRKNSPFRSDQQASPTERVRAGSPQDRMPSGPTRQR